MMNAIFIAFTMSFCSIGDQNNNITQIPIQQQQSDYLLVVARKLTTS